MRQINLLTLVAMALYGAVYFYQVSTVAASPPGSELELRGSHTPDTSSACTRHAPGPPICWQLYERWTRLKQGHLITLIFLLAYFLQASAAAHQLRFPPPQPCLVCEACSPTLSVPCTHSVHAVHMQCIYTQALSVLCEVWHLSRFIRRG